MEGIDCPDAGDGVLNRSPLLSRRLAPALRGTGVSRWRGNNSEEEDGPWTCDGTTLSESASTGTSCRHVNVQPTPLSYAGLKEFFFKKKCAPR